MKWYTNELTAHRDVFRQMKLYWRTVTCLLYACCRWGDGYRPWWYGLYAAAAAAAAAAAVAGSRPNGGGGGGAGAGGCWAPSLWPESSGRYGWNPLRVISGPGAGTDPPPLLRPLVAVYSETSSVGRDDPPRDVTGCSCAEPPRSWQTDILQFLCETWIKISHWMTENYTTVYNTNK